MQAEFTLPGRIYAAIQSFAAKNDVRYYLNGVHAVSNGHRVTLEATSGHKAISYTLDHECGPFDVILPLVKVGKKNDVTVVVDEALNRAWVQQGAWAMPPIDGTFPDVSRVMPDAEECSGEQMAFDPCLLASAYQALEEIRKGEGLFYAPTRLHSNGENGALLTARAMPHVTTVVMPMRD